jgi:hypothetical protein
MDYCVDCAKCVYDEHAGTYRCKKRRHTILMPERYLACEDIEKKLLEEKENELS